MRSSPRPERPFPGRSRPGKALVNHKSLILVNHRPRARGRLPAFVRLWPLPAGARAPARCIVPRRPPLPRRRHQRLLFALAALALALRTLADRARGAVAHDHLAVPADAHRSAQRRSASARRRSRRRARRRASGAAPTIASRRGRNRLRLPPARSRKKKKKPSRSPAIRVRLPPPPPTPRRSAAGRRAAHTLAQQIAARAAYADAYKPPDAPPRRPLVPIRTPFEPLGIRVGTFLLKPSIEVTRGYDTNPERTLDRQALGLHRGRAGAEGALGLVGARVGRRRCAAAIRGYDKLPSLNRPMLDAKAYRAHRRLARHQRSTSKAATSFRPTIRAARTCRPISPSCRSSTTYGSAARPDAALQPSRAAGQGQRRPHRLSGLRAHRRHDRRATTTATSTSTAAQLRGSYEVFPGVKPFVEIGADTRKHDLQFDRNGFAAQFERAHAEGRHHVRDRRASSPARSRSAI